MVPTECAWFVWGHWGRVAEALRLIEDVARAEEVLADYRIANEVFLLGGLSSGVTIYKQQVRAHNLAFALASSSLKGHLGSVAVVGGGIAGLTFAAALSTLFPMTRLTLFEQKADLCPLQQGSETRWVHPHIYDWPAVGSHRPQAELPLLDWSEETAGMVADTVLRKFSQLFGPTAAIDEGRDNTATAPEIGTPSLDLYTGVTHLRIPKTLSTVEWVGTSSKLVAGHVVAGNPRGGSDQFDAIVIASGFGLESAAGEFEPISYWRNDMLGQPVLSRAGQAYVVSGYGDGAIVDLCRLTIAGFRQGRVLDDLWGASLPVVEDRLAACGFASAATEGRLRSLYEGSEDLRALIDETVATIRPRLRRDVLVILGMRGKGPPNSSIWQALGGRSSTLNKLLLLVLFKAGAFVPRFEPLDLIQREFGISSRNIIVRHGTAAMKNVLSLFEQPDMILKILEDIHSNDNQIAQPLWPLGKFAPQ